MCLVTEQEEAIEATEDIKVYKVFRYSIENKDILYSPYREFEYNIKTGLEFIATRFKNTLTNIVSETEFRADIGIHSYATENDGLHELVYQNWGPHNVNSNAFIMVTCYIPKGTLYYKGKFANCQTYCSKKIIIDKENLKRQIKQAEKKIKSRN